MCPEDHVVGQLLSSNRRSFSGSQHAASMGQSHPQRIPGHCEKGQHIPKPTGRYSNVDFESQLQAPEKRISTTMYHLYIQNYQSKGLLDVFGCFWSIGPIRSHISPGQRDFLSLEKPTGATTSDGFHVRSFNQLLATCSMYDIFTYLQVILRANVGKQSSTMEHIWVVVGKCWETLTVTVVLQSIPHSFPIFNLVPSSA